MLYESEYYGVQTVPFAPELKHHGIKCQKWGVRRFQNADGSLTDAGRKRYGADGMTSADRNKMILSLRGDGRLNFDKLPDTKAKREYLDATNSYAETYRKLSDELDKGLYKDDETYIKYGTKSADEAWNSLSESERKNSDYKSWVDWYLWDDGDQGAKTAVDYYYEDHPEREQIYRKLYRDLQTASDRQLAAQDAYKKELVSDQGSKPVQRYHAYITFTNDGKRQKVYRTNDKGQKVTTDESLMRVIVNELYDHELDLLERATKSK